MNVQAIINKLNILETKFNLLNEREKIIINKIKELNTNVTLISNARKFLIDFSEFTKKVVKNRIENLVNTALEAVFVDKKLEFIMLPAQTKRGLTFELYLKTDNILMPLRESKGGGVLDICSMAIRISFLKMFGNLRQVMILDEPLKNIDKYRKKLAGLWLKYISETLGIQIIMITHDDEFIECADRIIEIKNIDNVSMVKTVL